MITFVLWKWQKPPRVDLRRRRVRYTAQHVNTVCSMLARCYTLRHRVVCFTDDPIGVECETQPIPAPELLRLGACWHRLWLFSNEARRLGERVVSLDLDTVLVDNVNRLFDTNQPFKIWRGSYEGIVYCGSLWMLETGAFPWVWEQFISSGDSLSRMKIHGNSYKHPDCLAAGHRVGSDQAWIALKLPGMPTWTSADGVVSYRLEARGALPPGARIVNFHGLEDPSLSVCQKESPWILDHWR